MEISSFFGKLNFFELLLKQRNDILFILNCNRHCVRFNKSYEEYLKEEICIFFFKYRGKFLKVIYNDAIESYTGAVY